MLQKKKKNKINKSKVRENSKVKNILKKGLGPLMKLLPIHLFTIRNAAKFEIINISPLIPQAKAKFYLLVFF